MECKVCGRTVGRNGIRMNVCYNCVEAESIILDGTDMEDKQVAETPMEKLLLVAKLLK